MEGNESDVEVCSDILVKLKQVFSADISNINRRLIMQRTILSYIKLFVVIVIKMQFGKILTDFVCKALFTVSLTA